MDRKTQKPLEELKLLYLMMLMYLTVLLYLTTFMYLMILLYLPMMPDDLIYLMMLMYMTMFLYMVVLLYLAVCSCVHLLQLLHRTPADSQGDSLDSLPFSSPALDRYIDTQKVEESTF